MREIHAQQIDAARTALSRGDRPAAAESLRSAVDAAHGDPDLERELAPVLIQLGKLEQELGRPAEAERLLHEALAIGERLFGAEHASLGVVLNELGRLHIRQSNHARAESVMERLLRIARSKGEEHPDVATALAGLAVVSRGLGHDATAERRFRDALRIREKVLAPNHMAIVVTLEQLSDTCAARGELVEALALLQRALPTREAALGTDHATVSALRSRIAALELRIASVAVSPTAAVAAEPTIEVQPAILAHPQPAAADSVAPRRSRELTFIYEPEPMPAPSPAPRRPARTSAPTALASPAPASQRAWPSWMTPPTTDSSTRNQERPRGEGVADRALAVDDLGQSSRQPSFAPGLAASREPSPRRRAALFSSVGLAAAALVIAVLASRSDAASWGGIATDEVDAGQHAASVATTGSATLQLLAPSGQLESVTRDSVVTPSLPTLPTAPRGLPAMTVPTIVATNVDSLVGASTAIGLHDRADQIGSSGGLESSPIGHDAAARPPVLIGPAPQPHFPELLRSRRTEGEVVVRFRVDEHGRVDVSSMKVVKSDHDLFTLAVRNVLPRFRFEPARSGAPDSAPRAEWVDFRAEFTAKL